MNQTASARKVLEEITVPSTGKLIAFFALGVGLALVSFYTLYFGVWRACLKPLRAERAPVPYRTPRRLRHLRTPSELEEEREARWQYDEALILEYFRL